MIRLNLFIFVMALLASTSASAVESFSCGDATVTIKFSLSSKSVRNVEATLSVSRNSKSSVLQYDSNIDFIGAECRRSFNNRPLVVFQAHCGGSGCKDLDNFGVIDPSDLRVLLVPNDWNKDDVKRITGSNKPIENKFSVIRIGDKLREK